MRFVLLALVVLGWLTLTPRLGERDLWPPDEARYTRVTLEMADHSCAVPHLNGAVYNDKPPAFFWLANAVSGLTGIRDESAARWPSVLGALLLIALVGAAAGRATGAHAGFLAGAVLLATGFFFWKARYAQLDVLFAALIAASLLSFYDALESGRPRRLLAGGLALGLALVVKGPLALVVVPVVLLWRWLGRPTRPEGVTFGRAALGAALLALVPALAWLAWAVSEAGSDYLRVLLGRHVVERARSGLAHERPWWFYFAKLPLELLPWLLLLPLWASSRVRHLVGPAGRRLAGFALLWLVVFFAIQSAFPGKRSIYLLTVFPAFAILAGLVGAAGVSEKTGSGSRGYAAIVLSVVGGALVLLGALLLTAGSGAAGYDFVLEQAAARAGDGFRERVTRIGVPWPGDDGAGSFMRDLRLAGVPFAVGAALSLFWLIRRRLNVAIDAQVVAVAVGMGVLCALVVPHLDPAQTRRQLADRVLATVGTAKVAVFRHLDEGLLFYLGRPQIPVFEAEEDEGFDGAHRDDDTRRDAEISACEALLERYLVASPPGYCVIRRRDRESLTRLIQGRDYDVVITVPVGSKDLFDLIASRPSEEEGR